MIPKLADVLAGYRFVARRLRGGEPSIPDVKCALKLAVTLARGEPMQEPAALFYAFTLCRGSFPGAWREMALGLARNCALRLGFRLHLADEDLAYLFGSIAQGDSGFEDVSRWVAENLAPIEP